MKIPVRITLSGCDDSTQVDTEVTAAEFGLLHNIAEWSRGASGYRCQPVFEVRVRSAEKDSQESSGGAA